MILGFIIFLQILINFIIKLRRYQAISAFIMNLIIPISIMLMAFMLTNIFERIKILKIEKCFKVFRDFNEKEILVEELIKICEFFIENFSMMTLTVFGEFLSLEIIFNFF